MGLELAKDMSAIELVDESYTRTSHGMMTNRPRDRSEETITW
jgi:hypothetical protein